MDSNNKAYIFSDGIYKKKISRRTFFTQSISYAAGLTLLSSSGIITDVSAANEDKSKEEMFKELDELVDIYMPKFRTCSQTTFYALNKFFKLNADEFVKSLASFPGVALRGETCGAVTGSLLAIGLIYEENIFDDEMKRLSNEPSFKFCSKFEGKYGTTRCRDVIEGVTGKKYNLTKPEDYQQLAGDGVYMHCPGVIKDALHIVSEIVFEKT